MLNKLKKKMIQKGRKGIDKERNTHVLGEQKFNIESDLSDSDATFQSLLVDMATMSDDDGKKPSRLTITPSKISVPKKIDTDNSENANNINIYLHGNNYIKANNINIEKANKNV